MIGIEALACACLMVSIIHQLAALKAQVQRLHAKLTTMSTESCTYPCTDPGIFLCCAVLEVSAGDEDLDIPLGGLAETAPAQHLPHGAAP